MEGNPLFACDGRTRWSELRPEHVEPAVRRRVDEYFALLEERLAAPERPSWENFVAPLDDAVERVEAAFGPVDHLIRVRHDEALREAHRRAQGLVVELDTRRLQDARVLAAVQAVRARADEDGLSAQRRRVLDEDLRDFRLAGAHLPPREKERCGEIRLELTRLAATFADNVTDSIEEFRFVLDRPQDVEGLPQSLVDGARERALRDDPSAPPGRFSFAVDRASFLPFLSHQKDRRLRGEYNRAAVTRAAAAPHDNGPVIRRTLELRLELARLLGFRNFAEMALVKRMAKSPEEARAFLLDLAARARPQALRDGDDLLNLARERDGLDALERFDLPYYRETLRRGRYDFSEEDVRRHFPVDRVLAGLAEVVRRLYGVVLAERPDGAGFDRWSPDVRVFELTEPGAGVVGHVLADLFARPGKHSGAWEGGALARRRRPDGGVQRPVVYLVCNFTPPAGGRPSLLRHDEVRTLFHEFGHALHDLFSTSDDRQCAGTRGVPRDGVEAPSQFLENWIWSAEALALMSGHFETGAPLPEALLGKMLAARRYMKARDVVQAAEISLFDLELHMAETPLDEAGVHELFESVRRRVAVTPAPAYDRFENAFMHAFSWDYAAGYYGYAWAEVLAADAFSRFEEEGVWSRAAARDFREKLLAPGGGAEFMDLFVAYRGRRPTPDAMLRNCGLA